MTAPALKVVADNIREVFPGLPAEPLPLTEHRAATVFTERHDGELLYNHEQGTWLAYDGAIWRPERTELAHHLARTVAADLASESDKAGDRRAAERASFVGGTLSLARADPTFSRLSHHFDTNPDVLGVPGGLVDLKAGVLLPPDPSAMLTRSTSVRPDWKQGCPTWMRFLTESTGGDVQLIDFLRLWCGYCLTGHTREHALVFIYGPGGNGKSVFLNVLTGILGDYAVTAAMDTFTASKWDKHPTDLAMLAGARVVTASETEEGKPWAEARLKHMTGGDKMTARFMRQNNFEFMPQFKLSIVGNHKPVLNNVDDGLRRRFNIIPFERKPANPDRELEAKLKAEWPAILAWMVDGCRDWQVVGLIRSESIEAATASYFVDQDLFQQWLDDECEIDISNRWLTEATSRLFAAWETYAKAAGEVPGSRKAFADQMRRRGLMPDRINAMRLFRGVRLLRQEDGDR